MTNNHINVMQQFTMCVSHEKLRERKKSREPIEINSADNRLIACQSIVHL